MGIKAGTDVEIDRWYKLDDHPEQIRLVTEDKRIKVIPAGRRSGKTERFKRYLTREALRLPGLYFAGAPTRTQAKDIFWEDLKLLSFSSLHVRKPSETELKIFIPNGSIVQLVSMDEPARFEGIPWTGGGFDEFGNIKEGAWENHISPALDTVDPRWRDRRAWCWLFGVPEGLNHYYDIAKKAERGNLADWGYYHWTSEEILPPDVIEAAKNRLSAKQYRQEYLASFETATGRIYEDYGATNHCNEVIQPYEQLLWCHDQNYTPLSSAIAVQRGGNTYVLDNIVLESAISRQAAVEFVERYRDHLNKSVIIYGDPSGKDGEKHGHESDYTEMERILGRAGWRFERRIRAAHPAIRDRQNAVRARICNTNGDRRVYVNPDTAPWVDKGLSTVQAKKGSAFQEDQKNKYQHITTAVGYMLEYEYPVARDYTPLQVSYAR